jgi:hypothetical protein
MIIFTRPAFRERRTGGDRGSGGRARTERGFVALAPDYRRFGEYKIDPYAMGCERNDERH